MRLTKITFAHHEGTPREWGFDELKLGAVNLLVGKNASGKSRTLMVINTLAKLLSGENKIMFSSGHYQTTFAHLNDELHYELRVEDQKVVKEEFVINSDVMMSRGDGGRGTIYAVKQAGDIEFQSPAEEIAAFTRRDEIQHPFFDRLHQWGHSLRFYPFGTPLGREKLGILVKDPDLELNDKDPNNVIAIFRKGETRFKDFRNEVIQDMRSLDYDIEDVGTMPPRSRSFYLIPAPAELVAMYVKEGSLGGETEQVDMSQGMFRALSLIIQLNYSRMAGTATTIVIDDVGEGLDFERSCALINLLMRKSGDNLQLIMATNDRFVMNNVPLNTWSVLQRNGQKCVVKNYHNSRDVFEMFKITGMNNFDFFATDFINEDPADFLNGVGSSR